jgi:hypothetical protein
MRAWLLAAGLALAGGCGSDGEPVVRHGSAGTAPAAGHAGKGTAGNPGAGGSRAGTSSSGTGGSSGKRAMNGGGMATSGGSAGESGAGQAGDAASAGEGGSTGVGVGGASGGQPGAAGTDEGGSGGEPAGGAVNAGAAGGGGEPEAPARIVLVAGTGTGADGSLATEAQVLNPYAAVVDPVTGDVYLAEVDTGKIRHIDGSGVITTVVGPGASGTAGQIVLKQPHDVLFQPGTRSLFIADTMNGNIYRLDAATGDVTMLVGPSGAFPGATRVYCLAFSPSGTDLYFTSPTDVRVIDLELGVSKPAVPYADARVIAIDSRGVLYAAKTGASGNSLQVVDAAGSATDMPATVNVVNAPKHIAIDVDDSVLVADTELQYLRRYEPATDSLANLVGNGLVGTGTLGGDPASAQLDRPHGVFADRKTGDIYIADSENDRVLKITH